MATSFSSKYTDNFPNILKQLGASIIVSTYQAGQLIIIREQQGQINTHYTAMERPMGMAFDRYRLVVGGAYQTVEFYNMPAVAGKVEPFGSHDGCYVPRNMHFTGDIDIHEMAYGDAGLWLINTKMSCLCLLDDEHSFLPKWRPYFVSAYELTDRCHLNGLALKDGKPAYVTALGKTDSAGGWRANKANGGLMMDVEKNCIIADGLSMPHSPRWHDGKLWYLESGKGELTTLDPETGDKQTIVELPGFTRGLCFIGQYAFIGLSQVREAAVFSGLPLTQREQNRQCGLWVVDTKTGKVMSFISFTGDVQEIFAAQILPSAFPTILDLNDPLVRTTYSLPDETLKDIAPADPIAELHGKALQAYQKREFPKAINIFKQVIEKKPDDVQAQFELGVVYADNEDWDLAITTLNQVIAIAPKHAEAYNSLGRAYCGVNDWQTALKTFDKSIETDQKFARAHFNRSIVLFKLNDYEAGWNAFEWRWQLPDFQPFKCQQPQWQGEDIKDKTLLIHTEQGAGDAIQFVRYLPEIAKKCKKLIFVCPENIRDLFSTLVGVDEIRLPGDMPSDLFDIYLPIMSLGKVLGINLDNCTREEKYLSAPDYIDVPPLPSREQDAKKIGLVWRGSPTHLNNQHRSCQLEQIISLTEQANCEFYALNIELSKTERELLESHSVHILEHQLNSFAKTAAHIDQLDLIISVDTAVAHLAGSMNIPVWMMVSQSADWRWQLRGESTPWYPSMRLWRQTELDNWEGLIQQVKTELGNTQ